MTKMNDTGVYQLANRNWAFRYTITIDGKKKDVRRTKDEFGNYQIPIILAGDIPPNPSELLGSGKMSRLLDALKERYNYIILDTPPINMVTDAMVLSPKSDGVLFVVRANQSERGAVLHAVDQLEYTRNKILGFVLNAVDLEKTNYGYGHRYKRYQRDRRYGYGYSRGYGYGYQPASYDANAE